MFCLGRDYLEFVGNYEHYLRAEMKEYIQETYVNGTKGTNLFSPKGILDNKVIWYFNHDVYAAEAIKKWRERAERVNLRNIAVIMTLQSDEEAYMFEKLRLKKKLGIYHKDLGMEDIVCCHAWNDKKEQHKFYGNWTTAVNCYLSNSRGYVSPIDWIKFLNGESEYKRYQ